MDNDKRPTFGECNPTQWNAAVPARVFIHAANSRRLHALRDKRDA
jgi:hypothetical protein